MATNLEQSLNVSDLSHHHDDGARHQIAVIEPPNRLEFLNLPELWKYRELLYFLVWRDVKVRYKQTVLGAAWAVIQPVTTMVVFTVFFGRLAQMPSEHVPYPLFVFAGLLPWTFFSNAVTGAAQSVIANQNLITKVYLPRILIPVSSLGAGAVDFFIGFGVLVLLMFYFHVIPSVALLLVPVLFAGLILAAAATGILLSSLTVSYRDFRYAVPFLVQLWLFATPCIYMYTDTVLNPRWRLVLPWNPAYGIIVNMRAAALGTPFDFFALGASLLSSVVLLLVGCLYFRRVESYFADVI